MNLSELLEAIFCGRVSSERDRLKKEIRNLNVDIGQILDDLEFTEKKLEEKTTQYKDERTLRRKAESERGVCEVNLRSCSNIRGRLEAKVEKLEADVDWYEERRRTLEKALQDATVIPDIPLDEDDLILYGFQGFPFEDYDVRPADSEYYLLPYAKWVEILAPIQAEVKKSLVRWRTNISDCDDWAYVMGGIVTQYFAKSGISRQGAFMIVWDVTGESRHAYNAFIDTDGEIWIYEPQTGEIIGKLGETPDPYESNWLWFPGAAS